MFSSLARPLHRMVRRVASFVSNRANNSRPGHLLTALAAAALMVCAGGRAAHAQTCTVSGSSPVTCTGGGAISIQLPANTSTGTASGQSTISVSGATGTVNTITVTLNGLDSNGSGFNDGMGCVAFVLAGPGGQKFEILGNTGGGETLSGATILVEDSASSTAPLGNFSGWSAGGGTAKPSSYWADPNGFCATTAVPAEFNGDSLPQSDGSATLDGIFGHTAPNGTWTLSIDINDPSQIGNTGVSDPISITSWSMAMTFNAGAADSTATVVSSNTANPASTASSITYTATVTDLPNSGTVVGDGTVAFTANGATIAGCGAKPVSGGQATCATTFSAQGLYGVVASYTAGTGFTSSTSAPLEQIAEVPSTGPTVDPNGDKWCNTGSLAVLGTVEPVAYPSVIKVSGYTAGTTVANIEVELESVTGFADAQHLLVAPDGTHNLDFFDQGFDSAFSTSSPVNLNFFDNGFNGQTSGYPDPGGNSGPSSGDYEASDESTATDTFSSSTAHTYDNSIPQVPGAVNFGYDEFSSGAHGPITETFESNFSGVSPNGTWALYAFQPLALNETIGGGWCIILHNNSSSAVATTTTLSSSANPAVAQAPVTLTADVNTTSGNSPVTNGGNVTFLENNAAPAGTTGGDNVVNLGTTGPSAGQASFTTGSGTNGVSTSVDIGSVNGSGPEHFMTIYEGDYEMSAAYSGVANQDAASEVNLWQRFDDATTLSAGGGGSINACNTGAVLLSQVNNKGPFDPNPSNIFISGLPGTVNTVTLSLNGIYTSNAGSLQDTESLIKGPTGAAFDFFSNTGDTATQLGTTTGPLGTFTFTDSASSTVPFDTGAGITTIAAGSYKPTANGTSADTFTSSQSGFYNAPTSGSITYAQPHGAGTFASVFGGTNPNGTWSLFFNTTNNVPAEGAQSGWCLNFTENPVTVTADESHNGTGTSGDFIAGETAAQIITKVNVGSGNGPTGDPLGTNPLKVIDTLNAALTYTGFTGTGWSCSAAVQTVTCTNDSAIAAGSAYPTLSLNVNVSGSAPTSISNSSSVSGAGITSTTSNTDSITVEGAATLAITKSHTGSFTQGSTGTWTLVVSNTAATGSTSGTVTVSDTLPTGYTLSSFTSTGSLFNCTGTSTVTCTGTPGIAAGGNNTITLTVNVPSNSPTSVSNTASTWGGGDTVHNSAGTAATSNTDTVSVIATTTTTAANETANFNPTSQSVTLSATVTSGAGTVNAGTVTFTVMNGGTQIGAAVGPVSVTNGSVSATYTLPGGTAVGTYTIVSSYTAAGNFTSSSDNTHTLTVNAASTTTTASTQSATYSASAQNVTLSATVTSGAGTVNAGTVTFTVLNGATPVGVATTSGTVTAGTASVSYALPAGTAGGTYIIQAIYNGSTDFAGSIDNTHTLTVTGGSTTTTASSAIVAYSSNSQPVLLSATVTSTGGTVNSGTVTFIVTQGATQIGTAAGPASVSGGTASATYTLPGGTGAGTYTVVASYTGAGGFTSSSDSAHTLTVSQAATTTTASNQTATFSSSSQVVTLSATVTSGAGTVNGGTITFILLSGGPPIGTPTTSGPVTGGSASVSYTLPAGTPAGAYNIQAIYNGSTNFTGSADGAHTLTVSGAGTITIANNVTTTFNPGNPQPFTLSAAVNSPAGLVNEGAVTFTVLNGGTPILTVLVAVTAGTASVPFSVPVGTPVGSYTIQALYTDPGGNFTNSGDTTHTLTVNPVQTFVVLNTNDSGSGSLRAALASASTAGGGNIIFDAGAFGSGATITLQSGLTIPDNTTITGLTSGSGNLVTVSGNNAYRIFQVNSGSASIVVANLNLAHGSGNGGAIYNNGGALTVTGSTLPSNTGTTGGAIWTAGALTVSDSTFALNSVTNGGGAIYNASGTVTVTNSTFAQNSAATGGGAIWNNDTVTVIGSTFYGNAATGASGGAIQNAGVTATIENSIFSHNTATTGGAVWNNAALTESYNDFDNNTVFGFTASGTDVSGAANLAPPGNYGGPTQTLIPLPGSAAICSGSATLATNAGITFDQRGFALNAGGYCAAGSIDAGAVQTNYAISFTAPVSNVAPNTAMNPAPAVTLDESGATFTGAAVTIPLTLTSNPTGATLSGGSASTSAGVATYSTLSVNQPGTGDQLTATLVLNTSPAVSLSAQSGTFTVSKITPTLSFAPNPASQTYGTGIPLGSLDATATYNSATVPGTFGYTTMVGGNPVTLVPGTTALPAGSYTITATFTPSDTAVYTGATATASFTVNMAGLTITGSTATMNYGGTVPTITPIYSGFVNGDTAASLTTPPTCSTTATSHSSVGTYPSSCSGAVDANYTISYMTGTVTVAAVPLTITASSATMTYGGTVPAITPSYAGFVNGDTAASLTTPPTCSTTATSHSAIGSYPSSCSGAVDANYTISYTPGSVTVGQAALTITASSATMAYGGTVPTIAPSYAGFVNGDTAASLTTPPTCSTTATSLSPVGSYPSTCSGAVDTNYTIGYMAGSVTVGQAASTTTVKLSSTSITPGQSETISVTVASSTTGTPTGSVGIYDGTALLTTVTLSSGKGTYSTTALAPGMTHVITAVYAGDTNFAGSTSTANTSVTVAPLDFTMTISGPASATVIPGQSVSYQVTVTPLYGSYAGQVNFATTGLPAGTTVTFSPSSIAANGGPQTITVTITTPPATASNRAPQTPSSTRRAAPLALAFLLLLGVGAMRRQGRAVRRRLLAVVLLLAGGAAATLVSGCGGGFFAQAPQNYNVTINATSANLQHSVTVTLNVQ